MIRGIVHSAPLPLALEELLLTYPYRGRNAIERAVSPQPSIIDHESGA
jgi:hypothetical protein